MRPWYNSMRSRGGGIGMRLWYNSMRSRGRGIGMRLWYSSMGRRGGGIGMRLWYIGMGRGGGIGMRFIGGISGHNVPTHYWNKTVCTALCTVQTHPYLRVS